MTLFEQNILHYDQPYLGVIIYPINDAMYVFTVLYISGILSY